MRLELVISGPFVTSFLTGKRNPFDKEAGQHLFDNTGACTLKGLEKIVVFTAGNKEPLLSD